MKTENNLDSLYFDITDFVGEKIKDGNDSLEISALLVRIGLEIYKSSMDQNDFDKMVDYISENRHQILTLDTGTGHLH